MSVTAAMQAVTANAHVVASPYCATPKTLLSGLACRVHEVPGVTLSAGLLLGALPFLDEATAGLLSFRTWHLSADGRALAERGAVDYIPARARDIATRLRSRVDVALVRVTPPDRSGYCSLGPSASYTLDLLRGARIRIAEIDPTLPRTHGADVTFPFAEFDYTVDAGHPISTYPATMRDSTSETIAAHVASLVPDGATVQLGIGAISEAVAHALAFSGTHDLRVVGMLCDAMLGLLGSGRVSTDPGAIKLVELLGTAALFDYADDNPAIEMKSSQSMHNPLWLANQPRLVSVCSALEVDLTGQVASEQAGGRAIAGVGGSADFFEGANLAAGGMRVVALASVTASGRSRIRPALSADTPVTLPRHSVDVVVTEYGIAHLGGLSIAERREALIAIAHPDHRDALTDCMNPSSKVQEI